jgi:hypothetical protein
LYDARGEFAGLVRRCAVRRRGAAGPHSNRSGGGVGPADAENVPPEHEPAHSVVVPTAPTPIPGWPTVPWSRKPVVL